MANADVAWVDVLPSARQFLPKLQQAVDPAAKAAGQSAGRTFGTSFGAASTSSVEAASAKMSAALRKTADAAGQVRVAEAKLLELRQSGKATGSQVAAAEERLAKARRNETAANHELSVATTRVKDAQTQHTTALRSSSSAMDEGTKKAGLMTRAFGGVRGAVTAGFAAFYGAQAAIGFVGDAISKARDLNETVNKANVIFGSNAVVVDRWAKGAAQNLGLSRAAALETAAGFGNMYTQLGFSADAAAQMAMKTVQLSADLGSFNNMPTADVAERIAAGFRGEYDSLQQLIPNISDARVKSEALAMTGKKNADSLTAQEKAAAVLAIVQKDGAAAMGDFARTSGGLANSQKILTATWEDAKAKLGSYLVGPATAVVHWLTDLIPRLQAAGHWVQQNTSWLVPLAGAVAVVTVAMKALTIAVAIQETILKAHPAVLVATALIALGAALVLAYQRSETFRTIVQTAFKMVGAAGQWLWTNALQPAFRLIQAAWTATSTAVMAAWHAYIEPAWAAVTRVARSMWSDLQPVFRAIGVAWGQILQAMKVVWDTILHPVWDAIVVVAKSLWANVLKPIFASMSTAWTIALTIMRDVWNNILHPMFNLLGAVLQGLWRLIIGPVFKSIELAWKIMVLAIQTAWSVILRPTWTILSAVLRALWGGVIQPIFKAIGSLWTGTMNAMRGVYDHIIHPMWGIFRVAINGLKGVFQGAVKGIEVVWNGLRKVAAAPINFIVRTVLRDGLFKAWNWVLDRLGVSTWHVDTRASWLQGIPGYSVGGYTGPGDMMQAAGIVHAGEFVLTKRQTERAGVDNLYALADVLERGYATGGLVALGHRLQGMGARVSEHPSFGGVTPGAHVPGSLHYSANAIDVNTRPGTSALEQRELTPMMELARKLGFRTIFMAPGHYNHLHVDTGRGGSIGGGGGGGAPAADPWYVKLWHGVTGAYDWLKSSISKVSELGSRFGNSDYTGWLGALPGKLVGKAWDNIKGTVTSLFAPGAGFSNISDKSAIKLAVKSTATQYGFNGGANWSALDWIIGHESGWNPRAQNPTSTASGLFQHIDGTWRAYRPAGVTAAHMKDAGIGDQARAGMNYIRARYGTPVSAQAFWRSNHWYNTGGYVEPIFHLGGHTRGWATEGRAVLSPDERVLSPGQDDYFRRFVDAVGRNPDQAAVGGKRMMAEQMHFHQQPGESSQAFADRLWHKFRVADRGGVHSDSVLGG